MTNEEKPMKEFIPSEDGSRPRFVVVRSEDAGVQLYARRFKSRGKEFVVCFQLENSILGPPGTASKRRGMRTKENIEESEKYAQAILKAFKQGQMTREKWIVWTQDELHDRCIDLAACGVSFDQDEKEIARQIETRADGIWERPRLDLLRINQDLEAGRVQPDHRSMPTRVRNLFSQLHRWL